MSKAYWKSLPERDGDTAFLAAAENEFPEELSGIEGVSRRSWLRAAGFVFGGALLAGCRQAATNKAIPYLVKPEEITPGRASWYASTCAGCAASCGILIKARDGRPIKLEGNLEHPMSRGGLCAVGQASILGLYDSARLQQPLAGGKPAKWEEVDREIAAKLEAIRNSGGAVRFLSTTVTSPTLRGAIEHFLSGFRDGRHVVYDPLSCSAILDAHERTHGTRVLPRYRFDRADVIASFDADFLGTWISPVEFAAGYAAGRRVEDRREGLAFHAQFESRMSLTGSKADQRVVIAPEALGIVMTHLAVRLAAKSGVRWEAGGPEPLPVPAALLDKLAERLWGARGRSLVVCGSQDMAEQALANLLNHVLGNYGATVDIERPSYQRQGGDRALAELAAELEAGKVAALFIHDANPVYELPSFGLAKAGLAVSFAARLDETAARAHYVCPDRHYLESWSDAEAVAGIVSLAQPAIQPLGGARPVMESLSAWVGDPKPVYEVIRAHWEANIFPRQKQDTVFQAFWDRALQDGHAEVEPGRAAVKPFDMAAVRPVKAHPGDGTFSLALYPKVGMLDGRHAYNPWLQELPDPVTKVTWDNYACLSPGMAKRIGVSEGDLVRVEVAGKSLELPAYIQPGQHDRVVAVAVGYGSKLSERFARVGPQWIGWSASTGATGLVGVNAAPLAAIQGGALRYVRSGASVVKAGGKCALASTQTHHTITEPTGLGGERRPLVEETTLEAFLKDPHAGAEPHHAPDEDLWPEDHVYAGHRWGMAIDLNACTGCSACVIGCQVENNVPVAGKDEVRRHREMHWMRIDRYYSDAGGDVDVVHQPMLCQHCEHAPCETVCPVLATVHSAEGLNQQVYNRCVGTRYCANNCPYKIRRFNWFEYAREDKLANMVLNPDVTVRSRGVMEKCSFCVQRIQEAKIEAKRRSEPLADGAIQPACQQSCPSGAIVFGDLNDPKSKVSQMVKNPRRYRVLEEINVRPSVGYLRLVRNREQQAPQSSNGEKHNG